MDPQSVKYLASAIALLPLLGVGIGLGILFSSWIQAMARNPEMAPAIRTQGFILFALTEAIAIFALGISLVILFG